ncbi:hypothetical protein RIF29_09617 [Crotalaria pallida]|uniref:Transmembrane protein n=1 Tax=Crotalaria pallida TaxID=3830 RepID=A0AAN9FYA7_CROPI
MGKVAMGSMAVTIVVLCEVVVRGLDKMMRDLNLVIIAVRRWWMDGVHDEGSFHGGMVEEETYSKCLIINVSYKESLHLAKLIVAYIIRNEFLFLFSLIIRNEFISLSL